MAPSEPAVLSVTLGLSRSLDTYMSLYLSLNKLHTFTDHSSLGPFHPEVSGKVNCKFIA